MSEASAISPCWPVLQVRNLAKSYAGRGSFFRHGPRVEAVTDVSLTLEAGTTLGIAGSSGCGKSTLARCISRLERPDRGDILFAGQNLARLGGRELRPFRTAIQMLFQDAATAMNPRFTAADVISEPLLIQDAGSGAERASRAGQAMEEVGLPGEWAGRGAHEFSGGQRQRLTLARALVLKPKVLILDEPLTGLDVSTRGQISNLLLELQKAHGLAYVLISHDLSVLQHLADRAAVMAEGRFVEEGPVQQIMSAPQHVETRKLVAAAVRKTELAAGAQ